LFDVVDDEARKGQLREILDLTVEALEPTRVVPFASNHYYRTSESADQNRSMLGFEDLDAMARLDERYVVPRIGDQVIFETPTRARVHARTPALSHQTIETHDYGPAVPLPDLVVRLSDHQRKLRLSLGQPAREADPSEAPHIEAHSQAMRIWLAQRFGDDTFIAGAHFRILDADTATIERWALVTLLEASHLDPQSCLEYLKDAEGRRFLWNRREEIVATLFGGRVKAGRVRL
jgi:hypothetical protein